MDVLPLLMPSARFDRSAASRLEINKALATGENYPTEVGVALSVWGEGTKCYPSHIAADGGPSGLRATQSRSYASTGSVSALRIKP